MKRIVTLLALAGTLLLAACVPKDGSGPGTSAAGWHQIAVGAGAVIGQTKADPQIERVSGELARYCSEARLGLALVGLATSARVQQVARDARLAVTEFCAAPPRNLAGALAVLGSTIVALDQARRGDL